MGTTPLASIPTTPRTLVGIHACRACGCKQMHIWPSNMTVPTFQCPSCGQMAAVQEGPSIEAKPGSEQDQVMRWLVACEDVRCKPKMD